VTTLKPGTVLPGPSFAGLNLQPGAYSIEIRTKIGIFAEILVIRRQNGKLISDFTLTRLSDAHILIPGESLLKQR